MSKIKTYDKFKSDILNEEINLKTALASATLAAGLAFNNPSYGQVPIKSDTTSITQQVSQSKKFNIHKVFMNGSTFKIKGSIEISDSKIIITQNGVVSEMPTKTITQTDNYKEFIFESGGEGMGVQYIFRFKLKLNENGEHSLVMEMKDNFTNSIQSTVYYLREVK